MLFKISTDLILILTQNFNMLKFFSRNLIALISGIKSLKFHTQAAISTYTVYIK